MNKLFCILVLSLSSQLSWAVGNEISLFSGYRTGGEFDDSTTGNKVELEESNAYGIIFAEDYGPEHVMEFLYSRQKTNLMNANVFPSHKLTAVDIEYFQAGGSQIWASDRTDKFFGGTLGAIHLSPDNAGFSSETRFAMSFAGGTVIKFTKNIGLRLEIRVYFSTFGSSSTLCDANNQCLITTGDGFMRQVDTNAGLRFRF